MLISGDVHVIDLDNGNAGEEADADAALPEAQVHLAVGDPAASEFRRNVTLVLKSTRPLTWIISSAPQFKGHLEILVSIRILHSAFRNWNWNWFHF